MLFYFYIFCELVHHEDADMHYPSPYMTLSVPEMEIIHNRTLDLLDETGMFIDHDDLLKRLMDSGADVDLSARRVRLPHDLVRATLRALCGPASRMNSTNTPFSTHSDAEHRAGVGLGSPLSPLYPAQEKNTLHFNFGGSALYVTSEDNTGRRPAAFTDFEDVIRFGNGHPRIGTIGGPPLQMTHDASGSEIHPSLCVLEGMTYLAKHSPKPGVSEINSRRDVLYAKELNTIINPSGSSDDTAFLNFRCTISPLKLGAETADVLVTLAEAGLPIRIAPMPLAGASTPVTAASAILVANAEIIGTLTALNTIALRSAQEHLMLSGVLNMKTGGAQFASPNVVLQDIGMAQLYRHYYDIPLLAASDYIDAPFPSYQSGYERALKILASGVTGTLYPSVGQIDAGLVCSPVQACLDMDAFDWTTHFLRGIDVTEETLCFDLITERGIGGHFLDADHTLDHFRSELFIPHFPGPDTADRRTMVEKAAEEVASVLEKTPVFTRSPEVIREIESLHAHELHQRGYK